MQNRILLRQSWKVYTGTANKSERDYVAERREEENRRRQEFEAITTFHEFLQGVIPEGVTVRRIKKMNPDQAFTVIWFLQEVCHLVDDRYEMCHNCKTIYDSHSEGRYIEKTGRCYCESCGPS